MDTQTVHNTQHPLQQDITSQPSTFDPALMVTQEPKPQPQPVGELYDVIIIGGGPAGVAAAIYCARKKLKTLMITDSFGGQSIVSDDIRNWIGDVSITGLELAKRLEAHVKAYPGEVIIKTEKVVNVKSVVCLPSRTDPNRICDFEVTTDPSTHSTDSGQAGSGQVYRGKSVIVASGARRRKMGIPGEDKFEGKGVAYCSTCDAPVFVGKKVAVVGGGNAGLEAVQDLFPYATEIYLMEYGDTIKGDPSTLEEIKKNPKLKEIILNAQTLEVLGDTMVSELKYRIHTHGVSAQNSAGSHTGSDAGEEKTLEVGGIFVEIGSVPNSEMVKDLVQVDEHGQIMVNFQHARTSHPGVFAAGDVTNDPYKQNNISVGDGVRAALAAYAYLQNREKQSPAAEKP